MKCLECGSDNKYMSVSFTGGPVTITCQNGHNVPLAKYDWFQEVLVLTK